MSDPYKEIARRAKDMKQTKETYIRMLIDVYDDHLKRIKEYDEYASGLLKEMKALMKKQETG